MLNNMTGIGLTIHLDIRPKKIMTVTKHKIMKANVIAYWAASAIIDFIYFCFYISIMEPVLQFVGRIHSELQSLEACPLQEFENAPEALVMIFPEFIEGIKDIRAGAEILLLTWLHAADRKVIKCVPRRDYGAPLVGVFSTRSPDRPNPIGVHVVKVTSIQDDGVIKVSGLEVLDQTPVIDIKPVIERREF
jgi:tRNA-Thr(GGU) m(6)t(6)A37 methyltransferase TsaA